MGTTELAAIETFHRDIQCICFDDTDERNQFTQNPWRTQCFQGESNILSNIFSTKMCTRVNFFED